MNICSKGIATLWVLVLSLLLSLLLVLTQRVLFRREQILESALHTFRLRQQIGSALLTELGHEPLTPSSILNFAPLHRGISLRIDDVSLSKEEEGKWASVTIAQPLNKSAPLSDWLALWRLPLETPTTPIARVEKNSGLFTYQLSQLRLLRSAFYRGNIAASGDLLIDSSEPVVTVAISGDLQVKGRIKILACERLTLIVLGNITIGESIVAERASTCRVFLRSDTGKIVISHSEPSVSYCEENSEKFPQVSLQAFSGGRKGDEDFVEGFGCAANSDYPIWNGAQVLGHSLL